MPFGWHNLDGGVKLDLHVGVYNLYSTYIYYIIQAMSYSMNLVVLCYSMEFSRRSFAVFCSNQLWRCSV